MNKKYAYIRVSTKNQKEDRQLYDMKNKDIEKTNIYIDKESGKNFNRKNYIKMLKKLKENDVLYIKSIVF